MKSFLVTWNISHRMCWPYYTCSSRKYVKFYFWNQLNNILLLIFYVQWKFIYWYKSNNQHYLYTVMVRCSFHAFYQSWLFFSQRHGAEQNNLWWWMHWIELQSYVNRADSAYNLLLWNESHLLNDVQRCLSLYFPDGPLHLLFIYFSHKTLLHL